MFIKTAYTRKYNIKQLYYYENKIKTEIISKLYNEQVSRIKSRLLDSDSRYTRR